MLSQLVQSSLLLLAITLSSTGASVVSDIRGSLEDRAIIWPGLSRRAFKPPTIPFEKRTFDSEDALIDCVDKNEGSESGGAFGNLGDFGNAGQESGGGGERQSGQSSRGSYSSRGARQSLGAGENIGFSTAGGISGQGGNKKGGGFSAGGAAAAGASASVSAESSFRSFEQVGDASPTGGFSGDENSGTVGKGSVSFDDFGASSSAEGIFGSSTPVSTPPAKETKPPFQLVDSGSDKLMPTLLVFGTSLGLIYWGL